MMEVEEVTIEHGNKKLPGQLTLPTSPPEYLMILTHGAGGDHRHPHLLAIARHMASRGCGVLLFTCKGLNIVYRTRVFVSVIAYAKNRFPDIKGLFIGGRSMGSRAAIASVLPPHDADDKVLGVVCLSYPLHTPDKASMRDEALLATQLPCLFVSGSDDEMAQQALLDNVLTKMKGDRRVEYIEGGNHALKVKGKTAEEITELVCDMVLDWYTVFTKKAVPQKPGRSSNKRKTQAEDITIKKIKSKK